MRGEEYTTDVNEADIGKSLVQQAMKDPVGTVQRLLDVTEPVVQQRVKVWERYQRKYRRGLLYLNDISSDTPLYSTNYIYSVIESAKSNMARNLPELSAKPKGIKDDIAADVLTRVLRDELIRAGLKQYSRDVLHYGLVNTLSWFKVGYDEYEDALSLMACHPSTVLADPTAAPGEERWIIHKIPNQDNSKIYDEYGKYPYKKRDSRDKVVSSNNEGNPLFSMGNNMREISDVAPVSDLYECWIRSYEPKRPNNWFVVTIANDTVLQKEYSDYDHNSHPFVCWIAGEDPNSDNLYTRGAGYIEEIESLQDRADALDLRIYKNIALTSNRQKILSAQSGINKNVVDNTHGRVLIANGDPSKAIYYDVPPQFGRDIYEYRTQTEMLIQTVCGIMDVTQGRRPTGIIAGRAIQSLKDSAEVRIADGTDTFAMAHSALGGKAIQLILQYCDSEKLIRATDVDKDDLRVIARYPKSLSKGSDLVEIMQAMEEQQIQQAMAGTPSDMGMPEGASPVDTLTPNDVPPEDIATIDGISPELRALREEWKKRNNIALVLEDVKYKWDVYANTDSALPNTASERGQVAADLFRLGAIDRQALLTALNYPDAESILKRLEASVTGKDAGDPNAEAGSDMVTSLMTTFQQILGQLGAPEEQIAQVMEILMQSVQQPGTPQSQQTGTYQPQITA